MITPAPMEPGETLGSLLQIRLTEADKTAEELAEAVDVPTAYINDLLAGRRRLPLPSRTDLYPKITSFCKLGRTELETWARTEHDGDTASKQAPSKLVSKQLLAMCEPSTATALTKRGSKDAKKELIGYFDRLLSTTKSVARRVLNDQTALRMAADRAGQTLAVRRLEILDFLDTSPADLTDQHLERFVTPQLAGWDVDLETGVLRVIMQS